MKRIGFGQVEPNHLSAQRTGQIYAQLPANKNITQLENGQFVKYDYENGEVNFTGKGEWMMVFNEVKLYDEFWRESYKDFAMIASNYTPGDYTFVNAAGQSSVQTVSHEGYGPFKGQMTPRLFKTNIGDIYTTNCLEKAGAKGVETTMTDAPVGTELGINAQGFLVDKTTLTNYDGPVFLVVKVYTMPDGQAAVKVQRIA